MFWLVLLKAFKKNKLLALLNGILGCFIFIFLNRLLKQFLVLVGESMKRLVALVQFTICRTYMVCILGASWFLESPKGLPVFEVLCRLGRQKHLCWSCQPKAC